MIELKDYIQYEQNGYLYKIDNSDSRDNWINSEYVLRSNLQDLLMDFDVENEGDG